MPNTEIRIKPKVSVGEYAYIIKYRSIKIHCPCCNEGKATEYEYHWSCRLVTEIRAHIRMNVANSYWYKFHRESGYFSEDRVYESREAVIAEIKRRKAQDEKEVTKDKKVWKRRQKEGRDW